MKITPTFISPLPPALQSPGWWRALWDSKASLFVLNFLWEHALSYQEPFLSFQTALKWLLLFTLRWLDFSPPRSFSLRAGEEGEDTRASQGANHEGETKSLNKNNNPKLLLNKRSKEKWESFLKKERNQTRRRWKQSCRRWEKEETWLRAKISNLNGSGRQVQFWKHKPRCANSGPTGGPICCITYFFNKWKIENFLPEVEGNRKHFPFSLSCLKCLVRTYLQLNQLPSQYLVDLAAGRIPNRP